MEQTVKPASKVKVALVWLVLVGNIIFWVVFWLWRNRGTRPGEDSAPDLVQAVVFLIIGGFFLVCGVGSYFAVIFSNALTFNFSRPVWKGLKAKLYLANIIVPLFVALGLGLGLAGFTTPALKALGLSSGLASLLPVMIIVAVLQIAQLWILIWSPLEKRIITRRLQALGITPAQLQSAILIGLSNPERSSFKKFGAIEEDVGALWISPDQLVYWGDGEQFAVTRDQLARLERKADAGSTTMLSGMTHVILHVQLQDGRQRQLRLHMQGFWTRGQSRRAMDALAETLGRWHANAPEAGGG